MERPIQERAPVDLIRYSNCWEDADILLKALQVREGGIYLSIASSGDNTFSLLSRNPAAVLAVDINPAQLACTELRKVVFRHLSYEEALVFLGVREGQDRLSLYGGMRKALSPDARRFWDGNEERIRQGVIHTGRFENYFRLFRKWILPLLQPGERATEVPNREREGRGWPFSKDTRETWRWRAFLRVFFSRFVMGRFGRDPEFFKYVKGGVADRIMERVNQALRVLPTAENPYLEYILTGNFGNSLPHYLREENFDTIRGNLDHLFLFSGSVRAALEASGNVKFNGFNLSDIFEYMSQEDYNAELERIVDASQKGARLVYWNMLVDRRYPENLRTRLKPLEAEANELFLQDKAFFYKSFIIEEIT